MIAPDAIDAFCFQSWRPLTWPFRGDNLRLFQFAISESGICVMATKTVLSEILKHELCKRGFHGVSDTDCSDIVGQLLEQMRDLELKLAVRELVDKLPKR